MQEYNQDLNISCETAKSFADFMQNFVQLLTCVKIKSYNKHFLGVTNGLFINP